MKKANPFNVLIYVFIFALAYILGIHSAKPREYRQRERAEISVKLSDEAPLPARGETCTASTGTLFTVRDAFDVGGERFAVFICEGNFLEAGFLSAGGKYICANQPISLIFPNFTITGRVLSVYKV